MNLREQIDSDIKNAMRNKEKDELRALRAIKSMILLAETEKGGSEGLSDEVETKLLTKAAKQRKESLEIYKEQGRDDLAEKEQVELDIISRYLPQQLSEAELEEKLREIITQVGASSMKDMGKVMGIATKQLSGVADGSAISTAVKKILGS